MKKDRMHTCDPKKMDVRILPIIVKQNWFAKKIERRDAKTRRNNLERRQRARRQMPLSVCFALLKK